MALFKMQSWDYGIYHHQNYLGMLNRQPQWEIWD